MKKAALILLLLAGLGYGAWVGHGAAHITFHEQSIPKNASLLDFQDDTLTIEEYDLLREQFPDASILWNVPFQGEFYPLSTREITVSRISEDEIAPLAYLPKLETIHADGCRDFDTLFVLQEMGYQVLDPVELGEESYPFDTEKLTLQDISVQELEAALPGLPRLKQVQFQGELSPADQLLRLREEYPDITFQWEVTLGGKVWKDNTKKLLLRDVDLTEESDIAGAIARLPELTSADFTGTGLSQEDLKELCDAFPQVFFLWQIDVGPVTIPTDTVQLNLSNQKLDSVSVLENAMPYLPKLEWVDLSFCGLPDEELDALNRRHEDVRIVWTVTIDRVRVRTDETTFMPVKQKDWIDSRHVYPLRYCTDMVCVDIGHMAVDNCEWAAFMPNLEYLILGETRVVDLSPLGGLKKLKFLELFTIPARDYSPLVGCTALEDLNLGLTYGDPAPIAQMTWLKHLWWCDAANRKYRFWEEADALSEALPNTQIKFRIQHPTAGGWRHLPNYYAMRDVLEMPYLDQ